jgi:hypothetical protein
MSIKRTFNGASIVSPGAYTRLIVENLTGFPLQATGIVGIVGEAVGGEPRVLDILERTQIQSAKERYKSGPIADALELLANPSKDPRIANGASKIVVYKVNLSTQASALLKSGVPEDIITLLSRNYGSDENNLNVLVSPGAILDANALLAGTIAETFNLSGGSDTLILTINGVVYTYTSSLSGAAETAAAVIADLNMGGNWAPSRPITAAPTTLDPTKIEIELDQIAGAELDYGYMEVDPTSTLDTILGITGSNRGIKGSRILTFVKGTEEEITPELGGVGVLSVRYVGAGTQALLSVKEISSELKLQTTVTGGPGGEDLDILLVDAEGKNRLTITELALQIDQLAAYEATVLFTQNPDLNVSELDFYEDLSIIDVAGQLNRDIFDITDYINTFSLLSVATKETNVYRQIAVLADPLFYTGGTDGAGVANTDWADGLTAMEEERVNTVVTLISKDKGAVAIDSVNALLSSHVTKMWSTTGRSERNGYASKNTSKDELKSAAQTIANQYVTIAGQQVRVLDRLSNLVWQDPWALGCIAAGLQSGSEVGEPITHKLMNILGLRVEDQSWTPKKDGAEMIDAGVMPAEPLDTGGFRIAVGNTTWGRDPSFVWNRISVIEASGFVAFDLRFNLELVFTGTKARTGSAEAIANFIRNRMSLYLSEDIIVGDNDNDLLGFKNLSVDIEGNTALINVSITPVQGIDFILPTIYLADIRQSA